MRKDGLGYKYISSCDVRIENSRGSSLVMPITSEPNDDFFLSTPYTIKSILYSQSSVTYSYVGPIDTCNLSYPNQKKEATVAIDLAVPSSSPPKAEIFSIANGVPLHKPFSVTCLWSLYN